MPPLVGYCYVDNRVNRGYARILDTHGSFGTDHGSDFGHRKHKAQDEKGDHVPAYEHHQRSTSLQHFFFIII